VSARRFAPTLVPTLAAASFLALFVWLGQWQVGRAAEKRELFEGFAAGAQAPVALPGIDATVPRYRMVSASGRYEASRQFLLDNVVQDGRVGYYVLTPLVLNDGSALIVNRGWVPLGGDRSTLPSVEVGEAERAVTGRIDEFGRPGLELEGVPGTGWPRVVSFPRAEELAAALKRPVRSQQLLLDAGDADGYERRWQPPGMGPDKHMGYAVQWFALAFTVLVTWLLLSWRRVGEAK